eukprot:jgi/Chlat1/6461/Chrsp45S05973
MGQAISSMALAAPVPAAAPGALPPALAGPGPVASETDKQTAAEPPVDYMDLPCPVPYEELQREAIMSLKPEHFEGCRFDFTRALNPKFSTSHSIFMGNAEVPGQAGQTVKVPASTYEFGANLVDGRTAWLSRISHDGRVNARIKHDLSSSLSTKLQLSLSPEEHYSQFAIDVDKKGLDWNGQFKLGSSGFYGLNYIQSVTPNLALGGEAFYLSQQRKSGVGFAGRYATENMVATAQVASTGLVSLSYVRRLGDKVALASDFLYNWNSREATASIGYDYMLRQARLRGRIDQNLVVSAYIEERLNVGVNFVISGEVDHIKKDYRFGLGMVIGE